MLEAGLTSMDEKDFEEGRLPLIDRSCLEEGYHIEMPRPEDPAPEELQLFCEDKDIKFFQQLNASCRTFSGTIRAF